MYHQPEPTAYLQMSTGFAMPHGLPDYTFDETPLRLSDGRGPGGAGVGGHAASALLYGTPIFSTAGSAGVGPAPAGSFDFHHSHSSTTSSAAPAASSSAISAPSHHRPSLPILLKMEPNSDDLVAQQAAAREYQPRLEVCRLLAVLAFPRLYLACIKQSKDPALTQAPRCFPGTPRRQENTQHRHHRGICKGGPGLCAKDTGASPRHNNKSQQNEMK